MPGGAPRYARPTQSFQTRRFHSQSSRLRHLTEELSAVQERLIGRLGDYQRECAEADLLANRAVQLTNRLKEVRERLQLAIVLRQRMDEVGDMMAMVQHHGYPQDDDIDPSALPGLGIDDDCVVIAHDRLPTFEDNLDQYVEQAPQEYLCPITCGIMRDPVRTADGNTYERAAIEEWMRSFRGDTAPTSPLTNLPLPSLELKPNTQLKRDIDAWARSLPPVPKEAQEDTPVRPGSPAAKTNPLSANLIWQGVPSPSQAQPSSSGPDPRATLPDRMPEVDHDLIAAVQASLRESQPPPHGAHWNDTGSRISDDLARQLAEVGNVTREERQREMEALEDAQMRRAIEASLRGQEAPFSQASSSSSYGLSSSSHPQPVGGGAGAVRALRSDSSQSLRSAESRGRSGGHSAGRRERDRASARPHAGAPRRRGHDAGGLHTPRSTTSTDSDPRALGITGEQAPRPRPGAPIWSSSVVPDDEKDSDLLNRLHHLTPQDDDDGVPTSPTPPAVQGVAVGRSSARGGGGAATSSVRVSGAVQGAPGARRGSLRTLLHNTAVVTRQPVAQGSVRARSLNYRTARHR